MYNKAIKFQILMKKKKTYSCLTIWKICVDTILKMAAVVGLLLQIGLFGQNKWCSMGENAFHMVFPERWVFSHSSPNPTLAATQLWARYGELVGENSSTVKIVKGYIVTRRCLIVACRCSIVACRCLIVTSCLIATSCLIVTCRCLIVTYRCLIVTYRCLIVTWCLIVTCRCLIVTSRCLIVTCRCLIVTWCLICYL